jgi:hypothetical protein
MAIVRRSKYAGTYRAEHQAAREVLVFPGPGGERAVRHVNRGHLRASHADRDQVVDTLKDAFVQGRLAKDEFDSRVGHALAARTHADLAALTADLPATPPAVRPPRRPVPARPPNPATRPPNPAVKNGTRVIAITTMLFGGVWAAGTLLSQTDNQAVVALISALTFIWFGIVVLVGSVMIDSRRHRRTDRQLPPASRDRGEPAPL